jgi:hypothetical protein
MSALHPYQASPARAEAAFSFLIGLGYRLEAREVTGGGSYRDGWWLVYAGPHVRVTVEYLDQQLAVRFERAGVAADYLAIDRNLMGWRSGLHGDMFPPEKLAAVLESIARDVRDRFQPVLAGDDEIWSRIERL